MMLTVKDFIALLKLKLPAVQFFNSVIDKSNPKCVGVYTRALGSIQAIGARSSGSYDVLPVSIVVHWTEDAGLCEDMSNIIYSALLDIIKEQTPAGITIVFVHIQDALPVHVGRDDTNVVEKVIRANIFYERGV